MWLAFQSLNRNSQRTLRAQCLRFISPKDNLYWIEAASFFACSILRVLPFWVWTFCCCWYIDFPSNFPSWSVMWLTTIYRYTIYTPIMLTIAHTDRGRPTLKHDQRFRHGLVRNLQQKLFYLFYSAPSLHLWKSVARVNASAGVLALNIIGYKVVRYCVRRRKMHSY